MSEPKQPDGNSPESDSDYDYEGYDSDYEGHWFEIWGED